MTRAIEDLIWEIRRLFRELGQAADKALAPLGITAAERALLEFLAKEGAPVTLSEIARKSAVSRQHIHQTLSRLNPRWVDRTDDPRDARSVFLSLSKEGRALWKQVRLVDDALLRQLEKQLDKKRVRAATTTLQEVREALKSAHEETQ
jgi:DNA-binding MarR family transcriptional regulator